MEEEHKPHELGPKCMLAIILYFFPGCAPYYYHFTHLDVSAVGPLAQPIPRHTDQLCCIYDPVFGSPYNSWIC